MDFLSNLNNKFKAIVGSICSCIGCTIVTLIAIWLFGIVLIMVGVSLVSSAKQRGQDLTKYAAAIDAWKNTYQQVMAGAGLKMQVTINSVAYDFNLVTSANDAHSDLDDSPKSDEDKFFKPYTNGYYTRTLSTQLYNFVWSTAATRTMVVKFDPLGGTSYSSTAGTVIYNPHKKVDTTMTDTCTSNETIANPSCVQDKRYASCGVGWFNNANSQCTHYYKATSASFKLSGATTAALLMSAAANAQGLYYNDDFKSVGYSVVNAGQTNRLQGALIPGTNVSASVSTMIIRHEKDPLEVAEVITKGSLDFGMSAAEKIVIATPLFIIGTIIVIFPCVVLCCMCVCACILVIALITCAKGLIDIIKKKAMKNPQSTSSQPMQQPQSQFGGQQNFGSQQQQQNPYGNNNQQNQFGNQRQQGNPYGGNQQQGNQQQGNPYGNQQQQNPYGNQQQNPYGNQQQSNPYN